MVIKYILYTRTCINIYICMYARINIRTYVCMYMSPLNVYTLLRTVCFFTWFWFTKLKYKISWFQNSEIHCVPLVFSFHCFCYCCCRLNDHYGFRQWVQCMEQLLFKTVLNVIFCDSACKCVYEEYNCVHLNPYSYHNTFLSFELNSGLSIFLLNMVIDSLQIINNKKVKV